MQIRHFTVVLLASLAMGQAAPNPTTPPAANPGGSVATAKSNESQVAPDAAVITVPGVCHTSASHTKTGAAAASKQEDCKTVITRAQFEALANALQPNMNAQ